MQGIEWWQVAIALIVAIAGWIVGHFARKGVFAVMQRSHGLELYAITAGRITEYLIVAVGLGLALAILGANIQPLLAVVIIVAVVGVLVMRGTADNFAASVLIQSRHPVREGDEIQVDTPGGAMTGIVTELNSRSVVLVTYDGRTVHVPNAKLLSDSVVNHSAQGVRRSQVQVRLARAADEPIDGLMKRLLATTIAVDGIRDPENAAVRPTGVSPERLTALLLFWHESTQSAVVTADVVTALATDFADRGVEAVVTSDIPVAGFIPRDEL